MRRSHIRINIIFGLFVLLGALLGARLFSLQVISSDYYKSLALRQHAFSQALSPKRGDIYAQNRNGEFINLAGIKEGHGIFINPKILHEQGMNEEDLFGKISEIAAVDRDDFRKRFGKTADTYEIIYHRADNSAAEGIKALNINGLGVVPEEWRFYPAGETASQVVGFVGFNGEVIDGRYGIEKYFEEVLRGESGYAEGNATASGFLLDFGKSLFQSPHEGYDIVLTINIDAQLFLEKELDKILKQWSAASAGGIIIEPKTGKILAMAGRPAFDPNTYNKVEDMNVFANALIERVYEWGSIFKPLTMAAALDQGAVTPETAYFDSGFLVFNGRRIENFDGKGRGEITMQKVLDESLNTGAVFAMQQLGKEKFYNYIINYGLDAKTDIELPGEVIGNISNLDSKRDIEYATASYGQGIAVTGIEAVRAFSSLANGGLLMKPYIVEKIIRPGEQDDIAVPQRQGRALEPETSETISRMLVEVVDTSLLGGTVKDPKYTIAAKTGTAYIPNKDGSGYSDQTMHTFFGYAPGFDAKFLVLLYLEKPQGVKYASHSLTASFMDIMHFLFNYYEIPPDR